MTDAPILPVLFALVILVGGIVVVGKLFSKEKEGALIVRNVKREKRKRDVMRGDR